MCQAGGVCGHFMALSVLSEPGASTECDHIKGNHYSGKYYHCLSFLRVTLNVSAQKPPFVEIGSDGNLTGYFVDLLDELAAIGKFKYTLESINNSAAIAGFENNPNGLINELYRRVSE